MIGTALAARYKLLRELGRGGMGVVYLAHDSTLDRQVAVKVIPPALLSSEAETRFRREARVIARMDHPAVVVVYDIGEHDGSLFFVMPYVPGSSLRQLMQDRSLQLGETLDVGMQVAEALEYSHSLNVIHRDIKPENILVTREERGGVRVRITDFGLARASSEHRLTRSGSVVGTIAYLSPEQVAEEEAGPASDVYSLGVVLYECLSGKPPFQGAVQKMLYRIAHEYPQPLRAAGVDIPDLLELTILRCLEKDPVRRFEKAGDLARELEGQLKILDSNERGRSTVSLRTGTDVRLRPDRPRRSNFVGREREMREIQQKLRSALQGECQLVAVCGEAGMGKTRLLEELANQARLQKVRVLHGRFAEFDALPYQGFCEVIQDYFRIRILNDSAPLQDFSDLSPDLTALFPVLLEIPDFRSSSSAALGLPSPRETKRITDRTYIFELLARTLARIGAGNPLVILMEDLHAADVSVEALQYAVRRLGPTPTLFVFTYRNTEIDRRHLLTRMIDSFQGDQRFAHLTLERWNASEHRAYLEGFLGASRFDPEFANAMYEATEGNPYFTHELIQSLIDAGRIVREPSGWSLLPGTAITAGHLPATIQLTVERRIERLPEQLRETLSVASVLGKSFRFEDLQALEPESEILMESVEKLLSAGFLEETRQSPDGGLAFGSGVIRDVLYSELSRRKRRSLHRRLAEYLEQRSLQTGVIDPKLLHHFAQGDVPEKVVQYGLKISRMSLDAFGAEETIRAARIVLEFLDEEIPEHRQMEAETRTMLSRAYRMSGNIDSSLKELGRVVRLLESPRDKAERLQAIALAAETAWAGRKTEETLRWVDRGLNDAREAAGSEVLSRLLLLGITVANLRGDHARAQEYLEETEHLRSSEQAQHTPRPGGGLVVALPNRLQAILPSGIRLDEEEEVYSNVFETLMIRDARGSLGPGLCERWESEDNGRSFVLHLRQEALWSDGIPLTAADVKHSLEDAAKVDSATQLPALAPVEGVAEYRDGRAAVIRGIEVLSEHSLRIRLTESLPIYPILLTDVKAAIARGTGNKALGSGPFLMDQKEDRRLCLSRNSRYWKGTLPLLDKIEFRYGLSASEMAGGLRSGEFDIVRDLLPQDLDEILRDRRFRAGMVEAPRKNVYFLLFHKSSPAGTNPMIRRALFGCIRNHDLVRRTLGRFAQPAECLFPPGILGHDPGRRPRPPLPRDKVIELLQASRFFPPVKLRMSVHPLLMDRYASLKQSLFQTWQEIGVEAEVITRDMRSYLASVNQNEEIDILFGRYLADYDDPDNFACGLFHSRMGLYRKYFSSAELDRWIEQARAETDPSARELLYERIESHLIDNYYLYPMFHDINYRVTNPRVHGLSLSPSPPYVNYTEIGTRDKEPAPGRSGGVVRVPMAGSVQSLDPSLAFLVEQSEVIPAVYETLTRVTEDARIVPWLASEFHAEDGGRVFHFRLRDDVRFHDGRRLTARDVRYSFEHLLQNHASASRFLLSLIRGAQDVLDGKTTDLEGFHIQSATSFSIDLDRPVSFFPALLTHTPASIIPEGTMYGIPGRADENIGTGPFRVSRFHPGRRLELDPNPDYWREGFPRCDQLVFYFGISPAEILEGFRAGSYTLAWGLMPDEVDALRRDTSFPTQYGETPRLCTYYVVFNSHNGPLVEKKLRERIIRALDVEGLVHRNLGRLAVPANSLIPPGFLGQETIRRPLHTEMIDGDIEEIHLTGIINSVYEGVYSNLAADLLKAIQAAGFPVRIAHQSRSEYDRALVSGTVDLVITRWVADYPDADNFVHSLIHSQEGIVGRLCGNKEIDSLIAQGRIESDPQKRHELYRKVEEIIQEQALLLPLFHEQTYCFARPEVGGFEVSFSSPLVPYEKLSILL